MASRPMKMPDDFNIFYLLKDALSLEGSDEPMDETREENNPQYQGLTGLRNLGNSCYMNAVIQCLSSVSPLVEYFLSGKYMTSLDKANGETATAFACLMDDMWLGDFTCVSPEVFRLAIGERYPTFLKKNQQDAQEFLIYVLNELHQVLKQPMRRRIYGTTAAACESMTSGTESSIITRLFEGCLNYDIMCLECLTTTYKNETFTILSLPVPFEAECTLEKCMDCFFEKDLLTWNNQIDCPTCGTKQDACIKATLTKPPKVIILHLKRFDCQEGYKHKLRTDIYYPMNLDLNPYMHPLFRRNLKYSLFAVVNHFGGLDSGHYTAFCRHTGSQSWFNFDDSVITEIPESALQTPAAYLLFYSSQHFTMPVEKHSCYEQTERSHRQDN